MEFFISHETNNENEHFENLLGKFKRDQLDL